MRQEPLRRKNLVQNGSIQDIKRFGEGLFWPARFSNQKSEIRTAMNGLSLGSCSIAYLKVGSGFAVEPDENEEYFLVQSVLHGHSTMQNGNHKLDASAGAVAALNPNNRTRIIFNSQCEHLVFKVKRSLLETKLQHLLNDELKRPLEFDFDIPTSMESCRAWLETLRFICRCHDDKKMAGLVSDTHVDLAVSTIINIIPHNYTARLSDDVYIAAPRHVKRAREYIDENIREAISMSDLCRVTGVTARTLQNGFNRYCRQTPSQYIRSRKLLQIHQALTTADQDATVTKIMMEHGVYNVTQWASYYFKRFGVYPSQTLRNTISKGSVSIDSR